MLLTLRMAVLLGDRTQGGVDSWFALFNRLSSFRYVVDDGWRRHDELVYSELWRDKSEETTSTFVAYCCKGYPILPSVRTVDVASQDAP